MSRRIEDEAKAYLIAQWHHARYTFADTDSSERGFDLWMKDECSGDQVKVELKATGGEYRKRSDIFQKLYFSARNEVRAFKRGDTRVVRVFLGSKPHKVFLFDRAVLQDGARFETEFRAKIVGKVNYSNVTRIDPEGSR